MADGTELPAALAAIQLAEHQSGNPLHPCDVEASDWRAPVVNELDVQTDNIGKRSLVNRPGEDHPLDVRFECRQRDGQSRVVDGDGVKAD